MDKRQWPREELRCSIQVEGGTVCWEQQQLTERQQEGIKWVRKVCVTGWQYKKNTTQSRTEVKTSKSGETAGSVDWTPTQLTPLCDKNYDDEFSASWEWLEKFLGRHTQHQPDMIPEVSTFVLRVRRMWLLHQYPLPCIGNMDETPLRLDMPGDTSDKSRRTHSFSLHYQARQSQIHCHTGCNCWRQEA